MTWDIKSSVPLNGAVGVLLSPTDVLYRYDTPLLFVAYMGFAEVLCYKLEELGRTDLYLVCPTSSKVIDALKNGKISIRGALNAPTYWIAECDGYKSTRQWSARREELPDDFLPESGLGLFQHFGTVPDSMQQVDAFISVKFAGPELSEEGIPLKTFKKLVDDVHDTVHKFFTPALLSGKRISSLFDFEIAPPQFASLLITIKEPVFDIDRIRRRSKSVSNSIEADMRGEIAGDRDEFMLKAEELVARAENKQNVDGFVHDNYDFVGALNALSPTEGSGVSSVTLHADTRLGPKHVVITDVVAERIRSAHSAGQYKKIKIKGRIEEVNSPRRTFIIKTASDRQVTCAFPYEIYDLMEEEGDIRVGAKVAMTGDFRRRDRRDYIWVESRPVFS
jgi:hypothetical protein